MNIHITRLLIAAIILGAVSTEYAAVIYVGNDVTAQSNWRTGAALEPDGEYGSDGYVVYGLNEAEGVYAGTYDTSLANAKTASLLPDYLANVTLAGATGMWSGNGNFGRIEDPGAGNALTSTPVIANGPKPYVFTLTRSSSASFRLTIIYATGDGMTPTWTATVNDGGFAVTASISASVSPNILYQVFDISAGTSPVVVSVTGTQAGWMTGFAFDPVQPRAINLSPADMADDIPVANPVALSWSTAADPNYPDQPNPGVTGHFVYMGEAPDVLTMQGGKVPLETTTYAVNVERDKTYYWRIDEELNHGGTARVITGFTRSFSTEKTLPQIIAQPQSVTVPEGQDGILTVVAVDPLGGELSYQWIFDPNLAVSGDEKDLTQESAGYTGANSDTLTILAVDDADGGYYYCVVSNSATIETTKARLQIGKLVWHWPLDGNAEEVVSGVFNGTLENDIQWVPGVTGTEGDLAADFDGVSAYINCGDVPVMQSGAMSVAFWASPDDVSGDWKGMISKWRNAPEGQHTFWIGQHSTNGMLNFSTYLPAESRNTPANVLTSGQWSHFVCCYDNVTQKTYANGLLVASVNNNAELPVLAGDLMIGQVPAGGNWFNGLIDDVRIYNYSLSDKEAARLYTDVTGGYVCLQKSSYDLNADCQVNLEDLAILASKWLTCNRYPITACDY